MTNEILCPNCKTTNHKDGLCIQCSMVMVYSNINELSIPGKFQNIIMEAVNLCNIGRVDDAIKIVPRLNETTPDGLFNDIKKDHDFVFGKCIIYKENKSNEIFYNRLMSK